MLLSNCITRFIDLERPIGTVLDDAQVLAQGIAAVSFYNGYAELDAHRAITTPYPLIKSDTDITTSEWAIIRPLFLLYVERENSIMLEASRIMGLDIYGRSVSEICGDIARVEEAMPHAAFCYEIITI